MRDSLEEPAVFLLGAGLALLIALLAWGEQIRSITRDTRELERDFLDRSGLTRAQLNTVLQARDDDERLLAFTNIVGSGKLAAPGHVEILPLFGQWRKEGAKLRALQSAKYWLTVWLTIVCLATGGLAALPNGMPISILLCAPAIIVIAILPIVVAAGRAEQHLNSLLMQIAEKV